jgi:putative membrane protein
MRLTALAAAVLLAATPALAAVSASDRSFLQHEAQGAAYELALAQLAAQKATRDDIKTYAQQLITDHEQANASLDQLAQSKGVPLSKTLSNDDQTRLAGLQNLQGNDFDRSFVKEAVRVNQEDKRDFAKEAKSTHNPDVRAYVKQFSAMDQKHAAGARQLQHTAS